MDSYNNNPKQQTKKSLIFTVLGSIVGLLIVWNVFFRAPPSEDTPLIRKAIVVLKGDSPVTGTITFQQETKTGPVTITGEVKGLDPSSKRGFHVHTYGDATNGCLSSGSHFSPFHRNHGGPSSSERHVGDLGNINSDKNGVAQINFEDDYISLNGFLSIIGRTVVVHAGTDDLGKGGNDESLKTGNAGGRAACGVIGLANPDSS